ncbi:rho guanine nucleotide exchange factor 9 [Caerostris extrusa]|uniref:Rho guanine nucleotide exchange factor 9 n=1 Tax=Caerostris extrusa TaxID=172846 RepID=A0AAV4SGY5_CAEEX|nr:rho guanine nucleotide exchange factor 9 [Caerostris extrusa]
MVETGFGFHVEVFTLSRIHKQRRKTVSKVDTPKSALNGDKDVQEKSGIIMGLGRNHILNEIDSSSNLSVLEEYLPLNNSSDEKLMSKVPVSMSKNKTPIVLRLQNKTSRSERYAKEDEPNLGQLSNIVSCSQPTLCAIDQVSNVPESSSGLVSKTLPQHISTPQLSPADGFLKRFRKSFAVRFKKKTEAESNSSNAAAQIALKPVPEPMCNSKEPTDIPHEKHPSNAENECTAVIKDQLTIPSDTENYCGAVDTNQLQTPSNAENSCSTSNRSLSPSPFHVENNCGAVEKKPATITI